MLGVSEAVATTNGWWSMMEPIGTGGIPGTRAGSNGDNGVALQGVIPTGSTISNQRYTCSFGTASSDDATNNSIIIRFKLVSGDYISALTFKEASH